ncbi:MAG: Calx-beta domain-containing protein, partial [Phormidesmis sp.]
MESVEVVLNLVGGLIDSEGVAGLRVGEEFEVSFTAVDLRADSRNTVYSFYTDVAFDPTVLRAVSVEYNDELATGGGYQFAQSGNINNVAGRNEDVGATSGQVVSSEALSPVVFTVRFELLKAAPVLIETDVPETLIAQTTVYGLDEDQRDAVRYGSLSLEVPQANPVVSIEATDFGAAEPNDDGAFTLTRTGDTSEALSVELAIAGSAINGADYETISQTVTFAAGASSVAVPVLVFDDSLVEDVETVVLTLVDGAQYDLDAGNSATVTIASNDAVRSVVTIEATDAIASESGDGGSFTITRTGDLTGFLPITLNVSGTATNGEDYEAILSLVTIAAGESSIEIPISVIDDSLVEPVETVVVELASSVLYDLGASSSAVLTIESDDAVLPVVAI